jgi:hypothetical protein
LKRDSIYAIIEERRIGMEKPKFEFYTRPNGHNEFLEFLESLTESDSDKMFSLIHKIQDSGLIVAQYMQWVKKVDKNLYEIRLKCPNSIQRALYFHVINNRYIITHGFTKKMQKTPKREIIHAKQIRREFEEEYYANN